MKNWITKQLGRQLSNPSGLLGIIVGKMMNIGNKEMYVATYKLLALSPNDRILELGFGNGKFIKEIVRLIQPGTYTGIEISSTMLRAAKRKNLKLIQSGRVRLHEANANQLPFADNCFNKIFTINTIYFWDSALGIMTEIQRVLEPEGTLVVSFNSKELLEKSEFTREKFTLYDQQTVEGLFEEAGFNEIQSFHQKETRNDVLCVSGKKMPRFSES